MIKRIFKVVALALLLLLAVVGGIELGFGRWFSKNPLDLAGITRDSVTVADSRMYSAEGGAHLLRYGPWGLRGDPDDPAKVTILTLGGMGVLQDMLPEDKTWQHVLQSQFRADQRDDVNVGNAGRNGYDAQGILGALSQWLAHVPGLNPRFVLVMVGEEVAGPAVSLADIYVPNTKLMWQSLDKAATWTDKIGFFRLLARVFPPELDGAAHPDWPLAPPAPVGDWRDVGAVATETSVLDTYRQTLKSIADDIHLSGAVPVFLTSARGDYRYVGGKDQELPHRGRRDTASLVAYNAATRAVCREYGFLCLDLAREVKFEPNDFYDYVHYSPQGADKIGRWLYSKLAGLV